MNYVFWPLRVAAKAGAKTNKSKKRTPGKLIDGRTFKKSNKQNGFTAKDCLLKEENGRESWLRRKDRVSLSFPMASWLVVVKVAFENSIPTCAPCWANFLSSHLMISNFSSFFLFFSFLFFFISSVVYSSP